MCEIGIGPPQLHTCVVICFTSNSPLFIASGQPIC